MSQEMELETSRLVIRPLKTDDASAYFELAQNSGFKKYQISNYERASILDAKDWIEMWAKYRKLNGIGIYGVFHKPESALIGICALKHLELENASAIEIMYRFSDKYWGNGFGFEAGGALVSHGFDVLGLKRIVATVDPENTPSRKILMKLGFEFKELISIEGIQEELYEIHSYR